MSIDIDIATDPSAIANCPRASTLADTVEQAVKTILAAEGFGSERNASVSVLITDDEKIRSLNRLYAHEDRPTDVLSFSVLEGPNFPSQAFATIGGFIGDIIICAPYAYLQATRNGRDFEREVALLAIHGALHLLGYDHAESEERRIMFSKTDDALAAIYHRNSA